MSCFEGLLEYYTVKGNEDDLKTVVNFVDMVLENDYTVIGCCAAIGGAGTAIFGLAAITEGKNGYYINLYNDGAYSDKAAGTKISVRANLYKKGEAKIAVKTAGGAISKLVKNAAFYTNETIKVKTGNGEITLCDYSSAGKNYDSENCTVSVWNERA